MKTFIAISSKDLKKMVFNDEAIERLKAISEVEWAEEEKKLSSDELIQVADRYDAIITGWGSPKITPEVLEKAVNLKFVGHTAGTVVPIVDPSIFDRDIKVVNANRMLAASTAELAFTLINAGAWDVNGYNVRMRQGIWSDQGDLMTMGLFRQTVGIIGYGEISKYLIPLLKPFQVEILLYSQHCTKEEAKSLGVTLCGLDELLKKSCIISLHNTLTPESKGMLGERELDMIQDGALLVNTARSPIIDHEALIKTLKSGRIYAAIDVYEEEPLSPDNILLKLPNVLCTPHLGGYSAYWRRRLGLALVEDLENFLALRPLAGEITKEKFGRLTPA